MRLLATNSHLKTTEKRKLIGYSILASSHLDGNGGKAHASEWFPTDQSDKSLLCSAACNRSHAFAWSVRVGCLISVCTSNVCVILVRKLDTFIHFVRYFCCLNMLECGKYFFSLHYFVSWPQFYFNLFARLRWPKSASGFRKKVCIQFRWGCSFVSSARAC